MLFDNTNNIQKVAIQNNIRRTISQTFVQSYVLHVYFVKFKLQS